MMQRRSFLSAFGKALGIGAAAAATPAVLKQPDVVTKEVIIEKIVEVEKEWVKPPRPDLSGLPLATLTIVDHQNRKVPQGHPVPDFGAIQIEGPLGTEHWRHQDGQRYFGRSEAESYGWLADAVDFFSVCCGARVDEDAFERLVIGERRYWRKKARRARTDAERDAICKEHRLPQDKESGWPL